MSVWFFFFWFCFGGFVKGKESKKERKNWVGHIQVPSANLGKVFFGTRMCAHTPSLSLSLIHSHTHTHTKVGLFFF